MSLRDLLKDRPPLVSTKSTTPWPVPEKNVSASSSPSSEQEPFLTSSALYSFKRRPTLREFLNPNYHDYHQKHIINDNGGINEPSILLSNINTGLSKADLDLQTSRGKGPKSTPKTVNVTRKSLKKTHAKSVSSGNTTSCSLLGAHDKPSQHKDPKFTEPKPQTVTTPKLDNTSQKYLSSQLVAFKSNSMKTRPKISDTMDTTSALIADAITSVVKEQEKLSSEKKVINTTEDTVSDSSATVNFAVKDVSIVQHVAGETSPGSGIDLVASKPQDKTSTNTCSDVIPEDVEMINVEELSSQKQGDNNNCDLVISSSEKESIVSKDKDLNPRHKVDSAVEGQHLRMTTIMNSSNSVIDDTYSSKHINPTKDASLSPVLFSDPVKTVSSIESSDDENDKSLISYTSDSQTSNLKEEEKFTCEKQPCDVIHSDGSAVITGHSRHPPLDVAICSDPSADISSDRETTYNIMTKMDKEPGSIDAVNKIIEDCDSVDQDGRFKDSNENVTAIDSSVVPCGLQNYNAIPIPKENSDFDDNSIEVLVFKDDDDSSGDDEYEDGEIESDDNESTQASLKEPSNEIENLEKDDQEKNQAGAKRKSRRKRKGRQEGWKRQKTYSTKSQTNTKKVPQARKIPSCEITDYKAGTSVDLKSPAAANPNAAVEIERSSDEQELKQEQGLTLLSSVSNIAVDVTVAASEKELIKRKTRGGKVSAKKRKKLQRRMNAYMARQAKERKESKHTKPMAVPICNFYLRGACYKGAECQFRHEGTVVKIQEVCKYYIMDACNKGEDCQYLHHTFPCKFHHSESASCRHGNDCKFSHDALIPETKAMLDKFLADHGTKQPDKSNCPVTLNKEPVLASNPLVSTTPSSNEKYSLRSRSIPLYGIRYGSGKDEDVPNNTLNETSSTTSEENELKGPSSINSPPKYGLRSRSTPM